jgi:hypothetical protein
MVQGFVRLLYRLERPFDLALRARHDATAVLPRKQMRHHPDAEALHESSTTL